MLAYFRRNQVLLSSCFSLLFSLYILTSAARGNLKTDPIGPVLLWVMRPLQVGARTAADWAHEIQLTFSTVRSLRAENDKLNNRIVQLEMEKNRLLEAEATNQRLRELLEFRSQLPAGSIIASIIANSASTWFQSCLLDKGSNDGVRKGMAVVTPLGVVGQVVAVSARTAKVLLVTDPNSGVDVLVQRSRARGILSGSLDSGPVLKYAKRSEDIQSGDRLITSGLDGVFPKGLMVGTVSQVRKQSVGLFQFIGVTLAVVPSRLEEVIVVSPPER
jgi:rod shape-determining protein MreC